MASGASAAGRAYEGDAIAGIWLTEGKEAQIEIYRCGFKYCGRIVSTSDPVYTPEEDMKRAGKPKTDDCNPDPALRGRPIIGLQLLWNLRYIGGNKWVDGRVYDPDNGNDYACRLSLASNDRLEMRGYFFVPLFGRTTEWTRVK